MENEISTYCDADGFVTDWVNIPIGTEVVCTFRQICCYAYTKGSKYKVGIDELDDKGPINEHGYVAYRLHRNYKFRIVN